MKKQILVSALATTALLGNRVAASAAAFDINELLSVNGSLSAPRVASGPAISSVIDKSLRFTIAALK